MSLDEEKHDDLAEKTEAAEADGEPRRKKRKKKRRPADEHAAETTTETAAEEEESEGEGEGETTDESASEDEVDPYWWTPHATLFALVLLGILGFFGAFRGKGGEQATAEGTTTPTAATTQAMPQPVNPRPLQQPPQPGAQPGQPPQAPGEQIEAQHLLVMHKESMRVPAGITRTKEEAKKRAEEALAKLKKGTAFDALVKEYSDEGGAKDRNPPGTLGTFGKGRMVAPFEQAAFALKPGQTSDLVETPFGYHIIKRIK